MTKEQVKKISELYKLKSDLLMDLSNLTNSEYSLKLCYNTIKPPSFGFGPHVLKCSTLFSKEIKEIILTKLELEINKIDLELSNIKC